jgi:uncharacterized protein (TIGR00369 family)
MTHAPPVAATAGDIEARVRASFERQPAMALIGATLLRVAPGEVDVAFEHRAELTQQNGFIHAGVLSMAADSACGYAAFTLMPAGADVLSVEFKLNLLRPAAGARYVARGSVLKPGRTITATRGDVFAIGEDGRETLVAAMQATMITRT